MTSSSYFELRIRAYGERTLFEAKRDSRDRTPPAFEPMSLSASVPFSIFVQRWSNSLVPLRIRLADETIAEIPAGASRFETASQPWLRNEFGDSRIVLEQELNEESRLYQELIAVDLKITPRPEVVEDFKIMVEDLAEIHQGLALDIVGRGYARRTFDETAISRLHAGAIIGKLKELHRTMKLAIDQIAKQPSVMLDWTRRVVRYRGGDRVNASAVAWAVRDPSTRVSGDGRITSIGKVPVRNPMLSEDLPEHRHIAEGLRRLSSRARSLATHCQRSADLLRREEKRWGGYRADGGPSVFEQRELPRIEALERQLSEAETLADEFQELLYAHDFLAQAGAPRTILTPTPAFLGRTAYREVYRALLEARKPLGLLVDGDAVRMAYRDLPTLYEYWCFLKTIDHLRGRYSVAGSKSAFTLVDEIYRPELAPGQEFRFEIDWGVWVIATYEPEFPHFREAERKGETYGASFTRDPLRPDITIELHWENRPSVMMVLDAKSTDSFSPQKFREITDYSRQIFDVRTGWQPIRQVVLLHRDRSYRPISNLPGYFENRLVPPESVLLAAVACYPTQPGETPRLLAEVIDRFIALHKRHPPPSRDERPEL